MALNVFIISSFGEGLYGTYSVVEHSIIAPPCLGSVLEVSILRSVTSVLAVNSSNLIDEVLTVFMRFISVILCALGYAHYGHWMKAGIQQSGIYLHRTPLTDGILIQTMIGIYPKISMTFLCLRLWTTVIKG